MLRLADGDTVTVYRVKYWTFTSGDPPALQLEYAAHFPTTDSTAVLAFGRVVWPAFAPYVEHLHLTAAVLTATQRVEADGVMVRVSQSHSYGITAKRDMDGVWRFQNHPEPLPSADSSGEPTISAPDGRRLEFKTAPPTIQ